MELVDRSDVPTTGYWRRGSVVINNDWAAGEALYWVCTVSGEPGTWVPVYTTYAETAGAGAKEGATVTTAETTGGTVHQTVLTLAATPVTVANTTGASFGGAKLYEFPAGRILVLGVTADLNFDWSATDIVATGSGDVSLGTTITEDATLDGTDVDLLPSTGLTDPFVDGVGAAAAALAASAQFDGTTTPVEVNINLIIDDADVDDAASDDVLVSGAVTVTWVNLGDY